MNWFGLLQLLTIVGTIVCFSLLVKLMDWFGGDNELSEDMFDELFEENNIKEKEE